MSSNISEIPKPIVIVTGANAGVGLAVCHRLLTQLAHRVPSDSLPQRAVSRSLSAHTSSAQVQENLVSEFVECEGITLILACRTVSKAEAARTELLGHLDSEVERIRTRRKGKGGVDTDVKHAERFRENVQIIIHRLDLASVESIFGFAKDIESKYPYISHLVCNAGVASFIGYDWPLAIKQLCTEFIAAVSSPVYKIQRVGEMSEDGLGWVWQCNVLGHYILFRLLEPLLERYKSITKTSPARIVWMSSVEALPDCYDPADYQLIHNDKSYEASKFQIDLIVGWFEQQQQKELGKKEVPVRHFLCHPGVVRTNIAAKSLNNVLLEWCMQAAFLIAHFLGSRVHTWTPYRAAISAVHLMLVALPFVTVATSSPSSNLQDHSHNPNGSIKSQTNSNSDPTDSRKTNGATPSTRLLMPFKFGSQCDYWFREYVGVEEVEEWGERKDLAEDLVRHCDELFETFRQKEEGRLRS